MGSGRITTHSAAGQELFKRLSDARQVTDALFQLIRPEALYVRPIAERHRIIFYIGHLEAFDWNLFSGILGLKRFHPEFDRLFAFGIDPVGGKLPTDKAEDWPSVREAKAYCSTVRQRLDDALDGFDGSESLVEQSQFAPQTLLNVAIEHRLMHAETLAYMLHQLPLDRKIPRETPLGKPAVAFEPGMVRVSGGSATLGLEPGEGGSFGWDNEFAAHTAEVPEFEIDEHEVTNRQYLDFVAAGGYEDRSLWPESDWDWIKAQHITHPVFWKKQGAKWLWRAMFGEIPLPLDWPVYVSHAEASAYARWSRKALPTEAQWHRAAFGTRDGGQRTYPWGSEPPTPLHGNFNFRRWDPEPVNAYPAGRSGFGGSNLLGNGWEWTSTLFKPFPGFKPFPFYPGYSANFFDDDHYVLKGGSARTAACMLRRSFRNWFQPHYQYVYAGFRCVIN